MIKLTQQQIAVLVSAEADSFAIRPENLKPAAAAKLVAKLIEHKLVREVRATDDAPMWREDGEGRAYSLKVLKAGRELVASEVRGTPGATRTLARKPKEPNTPRRGERPRNGADVAVVNGNSKRKHAKADAAQSASDTSAGNKCQTKRALILSLMGRDGGATLDELIAATHWLPHTTRAALTGLRKSGFQLERAKRGTISVYRVIAPALDAAAA